MRETIERRIYTLGIVLCYLLIYVFVIVNPNIDGWNIARLVTFAAIAIALYIIWCFAEVLRVRTLVQTVKVLALLGVILSSYLIYAHFYSASGLCPPLTDGTVPCDIVNKSIYAEIMGIPVAILGFFGYVMIFLFGFLLSNREVYSRRSHVIEKYEQRLEGLLTAVILVAALFTVWLNYVQFYVIKTLCIGCELSAMTIAILLLLSYVIWRRKT